MTREEAIALANSGWWEGREANDIVAFQLFEDRLCMPFDKFHEATEKALGRSIWTHEFGPGVEQLRGEFLQERKPATFDEILALLAAKEKRNA